MTRSLVVETAGPAVSVQDAGRANGMGLGLSRGGAVDRLAYLEGCALIGAAPGMAMIEMAGFGGSFRFQALTRFALSGAPMRASLDGQAIEWGAAHLAGPGARLTIGAAERGVYGYLALGGGIATEPELGGRGFHRIAGLGHALTDGATLPLGADKGLSDAPMRLRTMEKASGVVRVMPGPQTALFPDDVIATFESTVFRRSVKANRQGVRLDHDGAPFSVGAQLNQVSDFIAEGDIQMTGDGTPYVLLAECQTMGGYPRIGTVLPVDLPRIAQAVAGEEVRFGFVTLAEAEALWQSEDAMMTQVKKRLQPRVRDPREVGDLLSYDLIGRPLPEVSGSDE